MKLNTNEIENKLRENRRMVENKKKDMEEVFKEMWDEDEEMDEIEGSESDWSRMWQICRKWLILCVFIVYDRFIVVNPSKRAW